MNEEEEDDEEEQDIRIYNQEGGGNGYIFFVTNDGYKFLLSEDIYTKPTDRKKMVGKVFESRAPRGAAYKRLQDYI